MFAMFNQVFGAITVLFQALENFARAILHISTATEQQAKAFSDELIIENEAKLAALKLSLNK
jgi:hypothetical protein